MPTILTSISVLDNIFRFNNWGANQTFFELGLYGDFTNNTADITQKWTHFVRTLFGSSFKALHLD